MVELKKKKKYNYVIEGTEVPVDILASEELLGIINEDKALEQAKNLSMLPGAYKVAVMPDCHVGYGAPIGGVLASDTEKGGLSPGTIGYDINCGVRLVSTELTLGDIKEKIPELADCIYANVPAGMGTSHIVISDEELDEILNKGAKWALEKGYGIEDDITNSEEEGSFEGADASKVSEKAKNRGKKHVGTLGSGNHFVELQVVEKILHPEAADAFGLKEGQIVYMIHCGSRGLGHQVCSDYVRKLEKEFVEEVEALPDRELIYAPAGTNLCNDYFSAMKASANFAWANRMVIADSVRRCIVKLFDVDRNSIKTVYDVAHNIAKVEEHEFDGVKRKVFVHRKGATRAFGPGSRDIPEKYQSVGQPVIIPGSMGTASYVLVGQNSSEQGSLSSTAHGAGRTMSRHKAIRDFGSQDLVEELGKKGILIKGHSKKGLAEEAPGAYKDVDEVVKVSDELGIAKAVARLKPLAVIKG